MSKLRFNRLLCLAVAASLLPFPSSAQSSDIRNDVCPANYSIMGTICMNAATGDVVNPSNDASRLTCRAPYELIQSVCISRSTGDVEFPSLVSQSDSNAAATKPR